MNATRSSTVLCVFLASSAALAQSGSPQETATAPVLTVERPGDGLPRCGLGKAFHAGRRAALRQSLKSGVVVVRGLPDTREYEPFRQDKVFWYLTGIESPGAALVMDCESGREALLLPEYNAFTANWEGEVWDTSDKWIAELSGFTEVRNPSRLEETIRELGGGAKDVWISMHPHVALAAAYDRASKFDARQAKDPFDGRPTREEAFRANLKEKLGVEPKDFAPALNTLRRVKTPEEVEAMRRAGRAGALAMAEAMRSTRAGIGEWELESLMTWFHVREGAAGPAYQAIAGSGPNSLILHYSACNRRLQAGEVILIDYAPEVDHSVCDVTRTWPVDGKFTPRQIELYDAVLAAQMAGIAAVKPGVTLKDVEAACRAEIEKRGLKNLVRHGACHYIGMEVHDVGDYSLPLVPGVCFTIEPGLYEPDTAIGVRIEDVVIVTETGCEVVSAAVPRERDEIERLMAERGVLDLLVTR
jgi:Xaa-Pro aminopeptidase